MKIDRNKKGKVRAIKKIMLFGALIPGLISVSTVVACGKKEASKKTKKAIDTIQKKINELIMAIKKHAEIKSKYTGTDFKSDPNVIAAVKIFKKYGFEIRVDEGILTSSIYLGNKDGNISHFINNIIDKSLEELKRITIKNIGQLFIKELQISKQNLVVISIIVRILKSIWTQVPKLTSKITQRQEIIDSYYKDGTALKEKDEFWTIPDNKYSNQVSKGVGQKFYMDMMRDAKKKWNVQFNLTDWINVYDTRFEEITQDPHHLYQPSRGGAGAPKGYGSNNPQYYSIYTDKEKGKVRTGNNNNGLNGLYSGALFSAKKVGKKKLKTFDLPSIRSENGGAVVLGLTKKSSRILLGNGWEHVSPRSMIKAVFKGEQRSDAFKYAMGDLHNLRPSFQQFFNGPRSNSPFGMVPGSNNKYFGIDFEIGKGSLKVVEPRISVRGDIARILFYMHDRYHIKHDLNYYKLLLLWARMDPVTPQEIALDQLIKTQMGFSNGYVTGAKKLPFDQQVESMILNANSDSTPNTKTPGPAREILWSKDPALHAGAMKVDNPIDGQIVTL